MDTSGVGQKRKCDDGDLCPFCLEPFKDGADYWRCPRCFRCCHWYTTKTSDCKGISSWMRTNPGTPTLQQLCKEADKGTEKTGKAFEGKDVTCFTTDQGCPLCRFGKVEPGPPGAVASAARANAQGPEESDWDESNSDEPDYGMKDEESDWDDSNSDEDSTGGPAARG